MLTLSAAVKIHVCVLPTDVQPVDETRAGVEISAGDMSLLLGGIDLASVKRRRRYQRPHKPR